MVMQGQSDAAQGSPRVLSERNVIVCRQLICPSLRQLGRAVLALLCLTAGSQAAHAQFRSLENPSFEQNDPAGPGSPNFEIMPDSSVPGWETTTDEVELWDTNFNGVPAHSGVVFAEMNANVQGTFFQDICLVNGEPIGWTFAHRARSGGANTQTVRFQVANSGGTLIQTLATQASRTNNQVWNVNTGSANYTGATGLQRVQFTTTDPGSFGNFLDSIQLTLRPFVQLSVASSSGLESASSASIATLRVTGSTPSAISVTINITGGTATRGTDYTTPGGGSSFTVSIPAGTYNDAAIPLGISVIDDTALESSETITFSLANGTGYTRGHTTSCGTTAQTSATYTIQDNDSRLTLRKQWASAVVGDDATLTVSRASSVIDTFLSDAGTANQLDTDGSPTAVVFGETVTLAETLAGGNAGNYSGALACTGAADTNLADGLTIGTGETAIICTYTNTLVVPLQVSKTSLVWSDGISTSNPMAIPGSRIRYCILVTNPGPIAATSVQASDVIPANLDLITSSMRSGTSCSAASDVEDVDASGADETNPYGIVVSGGTLVGSAGSIAAGGSMALVFDAWLN